LREALIEEFGEECYVEVVLNRPYLAQCVFSSEEKLAKLNSIVHPAVKADFEAWAEEQDGDYCILESAILFESGFDKLVDKTVAILAPTSMRIERAMKRDGADEQAIRRRMSNQTTDDELFSRASFRVYNDGTVSLIAQVNQVIEALSRKLL
jgi:dephospho-CoA kinase